MTKITFLSVALLSLTLSPNPVFAKAPATKANTVKVRSGIDAQALDELMVKNCSAVSPEAACKTKLNEIRQGLDWTALSARAPKLPIDAKIQVRLVNDPKEMVANYYCLSRFAGLIPEKGFEADLFAYAVQAVSFEKVSEKPYRQWLSSPPGKRCLKEIAALKIENKVADLQLPYLIVLNPIAFLESGADDDFASAAVRATNYERLHAVFTEERAEEKVLALWNILTPGEQQQFKSEHPDAAEKDKTVLAREFFSTTFEQSPQKAYDWLQGKLDQLSFEQLQKELCLFCIAGRSDILSTAKELSQLPAQDLLARIEKDGVKVLILSSGRKNPSPLFTWGKVRIDNGVLNQITKYEGAMGKTLCPGERSEAKDGTTIILAADSPFSTLVHEYLHVLQIRRDPSWCLVSKRLWNKENVSALENRMIRDREWDVRLVLWEVLKSPQMTVEDRLIVTDGLLNEGAARKSFDPAAATFIEKNDLKARREKEAKDYLSILGIKSGQ
jgi:hypothetical protein